MTYGEIYRIVRRVPRGRVATYGLIARLAGIPRHARRVGYALAALRDDRVPWHRVVNAKGEISLRSTAGYGEQRGLLEGEGVAFDTDGRIDLARFLWRPRAVRVGGRHARTNPAEGRAAGVRGRRRR
jgi:methylated-DNA-protein-cysteine methyltransferase-like protein